MRCRLLLSSTVAVVALLAGCTDGGSGSDQVVGPPEDADTTTTTTDPTTTSTTTDTTAPATPTTAFEGSASSTSIPVPPGSTQVAQLVAVRMAAQDGFDRITFEFDGDQLPGVDIDFVEPPVRSDGSGEPVEVEGEAFLHVRMEPASGVDLSSGEPRQTYDGPNRIRTDTRTVVELVRTGDFEANLSWALGLRSRAPYRVEVLTGPGRVVLEVAHAG